MSTATEPKYTIELDASQYDQEQIILMEETLILLDQDDNAIGQGSKKDCTCCHLTSLPNDASWPRSLPLCLY